MAHQPQDLNSLLATKVSSIIPPGQKLILIESTTDLATAFNILTKNNIYSAPVWDPKKSEYYGFLDLVDIVVILVGLLEEKGKSTTQDFQSLLRNLSSDYAQQAKHIADISARNPMYPVRPTDSLEDVLKIFRDSGTHRVPVLSAGSSVAKFDNILSQSAIVKWLSKHLNSLESLKDKTVEELGLGSKSVVTSRFSEPALNAFKLMVEKKITAVAIVNDDGSLFSNLSAKDIQQVNADNLMPKLTSPTLEWIQSVRSKDINVKFPSFQCHPSTTFKDVIAKIAFLNVHRLYVVDENSHPIGVISLQDICKVVLTCGQKSSQ